MMRDRCGWVSQRLSLLASDELIGLERRRAERHILTCGSCRARLAEFQSINRVVRLASQHPSPSGDSPSLWPALQRQLRESRQERAARPRTAWASPGVRWGMIAAGVGLMAFFGHWMWDVCSNYRFSVRLPIVVRPRMPAPVIHPVPDPANAPAIVSRANDTGDSDADAERMSDNPNRGEALSLSEPAN